MNNEEIWVTIPEYPKFEVSNMGNARRIGSEKYLKLTDGRLSVTVAPKLYRRLKICDFVASLFIGEKPDGNIIWHINGDKTDNRVENLKYVPRGYYEYEQIDGEEWRDAPGLEGYYQISNKGRLRSIDRVRIGQKLGQQFEAEHKGRIIHQSHCHGYCVSRISIGDKQETVKIHRLVAGAFVPNPNGYNDVNHKNGNRSDNRVENLEWCTRQYNIWHAFYVTKTGLPRCRPVMCVENGQTYLSCSEASREMNIPKILIYSTAIGKQKSTHGLHFKFIDKE